MRSVNSRLIERIMGVLASGLVAGASCGGQSASDSPTSGTGGTTETRHAELAWAFVQWAIATGGAPVRSAVERSFEDAAPRSTTCTDSSHVDPLATHGRLGHAARAALALQIQTTVIEPCARALLA